MDSETRAAPSGAPVPAINGPSCLNGIMTERSLNRIVFSGHRTGNFFRGGLPTMQILVLNTGSSSVKFSVVETEGERLVLSGQADWSALPAKFVLHRPGVEPLKATLQADTHTAAVTHVLEEIAPILGDLGPLAAIRHRAAHGGDGD